MKYNYLVSSYNNVLMKYRKYFSRLQRDINNGSFSKLSAARKNFLVQKVEALRMKLSSLQPKLAGLVAATGLLLALNAPQAEAQFVANSLKNPFIGGQNTVLIPFAATYDNKSGPIAVDLDADGDLDVIAASDGAAEYFKNTGTASRPVFTAQTGTNNPVGSLVAGDINHISLADLDNDGDIDMVVGTYNSISAAYQFHYFKNTGTASAPVFTDQTGTFNPILAASVGNYTRVYPVLVDIDADGDKDIFIGNANPTIKTVYLKNTGSASAPAFTQQANTANPLAVAIGAASGYSIPSFVDIDGDGDLDAVVSNFNNSFAYYKNIGTSAAAVFSLQTGTISDPFSGFTASVGFLNSSFADLDADGDKDMLIGSNNGKISFVKNKGTATAASFDFSTRPTFATYNRPAFGDIDGDGDADLFLTNTSAFLQNNGPASAPVFVQVTGTSSPINGISSTFRNTLGDIDGDGDLDLFTQVSGSIKYYKNTGTTTAAIFTNQTGTNNPADGITLSNYSSPALVDFDGDGDLDIVSGNNNAFAYYKNTGTTSAAVFTQQTGTNDPFASISSGPYNYPTLVNFDGDGDLDLLVGTGYSGFAYFKNTGSASAPAYTLQTGTNDPFASFYPVTNNQYLGPAFTDIDADGDLDLVVGKEDGTIDVFENLTINTTAVFAAKSVSFDESLNTYPNPVKELLNFSLNDGIGSNLQLSVLDMSGSELMTQRFVNNGAAMTLDVSGLNNGIYMLKLSSDTKAAVVKFVKQ